MSPEQPNGGAVPSPLAGLAGGTARADGDTHLMPPPPPRMLPKPLPQASLNPLLVGATVVAASGTSQRLHNGDSTTSTSSSTSLPPKQQQQPPPPLAKRSRRGKIPLEKGYSQMEWLRTAKERQVPPPRDISPAELSTHSLPEDCWTALRGRVYDLTPYLKYHPGGSPLLAAVGGKDATRVFDAYHAWVNAGALLASCLVGKLVEEEGGRRAAAEATVEEVEAAADAAEAAEFLAARARAEEAAAAAAARPAHAPADSS